MTPQTPVEPVSCNFISQGESSRMESETSKSSPSTGFKLGLGTLDLNQKTDESFNEIRIPSFWGVIDKSKHKI